MKFRLYVALTALIVSVPARAALTVPGADGSDGALNITANTVIDLSQAPTGAWNAASPTPGKGVYDPAQWAVVFHYSSVNVASGAAVTFKNNASRAPVVWLVNGNVTIAGTVSLDGVNGGSATSDPPFPGPGGFRGSAGGQLVADQAPGFGPGGGASSKSGSYATVGSNGVAGTAYGNPTLLPLIGGSGAGGVFFANNVFNGAAGGGAILIAATGTITVSGSISANGGRYNNQMDGSGGGIRLVADRVTGAGTGELSAIDTGNAGGDGRIRIEANSAAADFATIAPNPSAAPPGATAAVFPAASAPWTRIVSVGKTAAPADPLANLGSTADIPLDIIESASPVQVVIETKNVATTATVNLRVAPIFGTPTLVKATLTSGNASDALWSATYQAAAGTSTLQVRVEAP